MKQKILMNKRKQKVSLYIIWIILFFVVLQQSGFIEIAQEFISIAETVQIDENSSFESNRKAVKFSKKIDGDTAVFELDNSFIKCRFLAIDTPETVKEGTDVQPYGREASNYTEELLVNANEIILEFDPKSDEKDKYGRILAWVWIDGELLQQKLVAQGYAKVEYIYGDYLYLEILKQAEQDAKNKKIGIWS